MRVPPRAPARAKMTATLNSAGGIDALVSRIAVPATNHEVRARLFNHIPADIAQRHAAGKADAAAVAGAAPLYGNPHHAGDHRPAVIGLPPARCHGHAARHTACCPDCFTDKMATRTGPHCATPRRPIPSDPPTPQP